ncbi:Hypothetical Protein FCC1311_074662 [Hondaea fermentalgiana]|uniref:Uncharacterized protein n=1 Tax=Hondaea fermentalgiana TaxID=2315210 RepID=A0A2R5GKT3_9STRA|nr:Hypothetical Protein FCC1311_074662 [Hondaea fermentalgiana]|eukprot:GBG31245.1 Hypothetical Protein FCC1311_074662 [Hondaea fermentalgiana]
MACNEYNDETSCELAERCYWATWPDTAPSYCAEIPETDYDCTCTKQGGCDSSEGPSGCQPTRFCYYRYAKCRVMRTPPETDDDCVEDGDYTGECVPSEYCRAQDDPPEIPIFLDENCIRREGTTAFPTRAPTPKPTKSPTLAPTPGSDTSEASSEIPIIAGASAGVALIALVFVLFLRARRRRGKALNITSWRGPEAGNLGIFSRDSGRPKNGARFGDEGDFDDDASSFPDSVGENTIARAESIPEF